MKEQRGPAQPVVGQTELAIVQIRYTAVHPAGIGLEPNAVAVGDVGIP